jgi:hypothetical protein
MNTNPFWLADAQVPSELKAAYKEALHDKTTVNAAKRVVAAMHRLVDEAAFHTALQLVVHEAFVSGANMVELLQEREAVFTRQIEEAQAEKRIVKDNYAARQLEFQPTLNQCFIESGRLTDEISALERRIFGFAKERQEAKEKFAVAGLTKAQIAQIGVSPTFENLSEWKAQLAGKMARAEQITQFFRSSPDYDIRLLNVKPVAEAAKS